MTFRKKNGNAKIGNISSIPDCIKGKYRRDMHLKTLLNHKKVTSLSQLLKKGCSV